MANMRFNSSKINQIASKIDGNVATLQENLTKLDAILEEVKTAGSGAAANSFYTKAIEKRTAIVDVAKVLGTLPDNLRSIAKVIDAAEGDLANRG